MLHVVAVEVLLCLSRRDLDRMCAVSKWLDALIALHCGTYPLRPVRKAYLQALARSNDDDDEEDEEERAEGNDVALMFDVYIEEVEVDEAFLFYETLDEALTYLAPFFRHSYFDEFEVDLGSWAATKLRVSLRQWTDFTNIFRSGAARYLRIKSVDLSGLDDNAFVDAARCHKLEVHSCVLRGGLFSDDVLRSCAANDIPELTVWGNTSKEEYAVSEDAILDFCFPPTGPSRVVQLDNLTTTSDTFAAKFLERLLAPGRTSRPRGFLSFASKREQRGLAAYAQHLVPDQAKPTYRFASLRAGDFAYQLIIDYRNGPYRNPYYPTAPMDFCFGYFDLRPVDE